MGDSKHQHVTTQQLAKHRGVSVQRINQYVADGMPKLGRNKFDLDVACQWMQQFDRDVYERKLAEEAGDPDFWKEKTRLTGIQADMANDKLKVSRGQLVEIGNLLPAIDRIYTSLKDNMLGLGRKTTDKLEGKNRTERSKLIEDEVRAILTQVSHEQQTLLARLQQPHGDKPLRKRTAVKS